MKGGPDAGPARAGDGAFAAPPSYKGLQEITQGYRGYIKGLHAPCRVPSR